MTRTNAFGQPIGDDLADWSPPPFPPDDALAGRTVALEPLRRDRHAAALYAAVAEAPQSLWTYLPFGPFSDAEAVGQVIDRQVTAADWQPFAVLVAGRVAGFLSYLRIDPPGGVIEIGSIVFPPALQRTTPATEAVYLLIRRAFDLGYRRCEWKCDDLNAPSRAAALRFGFTYDGTFRKATHYKGRNRDTAWFSITDDQWPSLDARFRAWLAPDNFDAAGHQHRALGAVDPTG